VDGGLLRLQHHHRGAALVRARRAGRAVFGFSLDNYKALWNPTYLTVVVRSILYALLTVGLCALIGYPVAYTIALHGGRFKNALIAALVIPFFASYLIRMYAWSTLLSDEGLVNSLLLVLGFSRDQVPEHTRGGGGGTRLRVRHLHDPADLRLARTDGPLAHRGRRTCTTRRCGPSAVTLPATRAGVLGGVLLVFLPGPRRLRQRPAARRPGTYMIGNLIQQQFFEGQNQPLGSALTVVLAMAPSHCSWLLPARDPEPAEETDGHRRPPPRPADASVEATALAVAFTVLFFALLHPDHRRRHLQPSTAGSRCRRSVPSACAGTTSSSRRAAASSLRASILISTVAMIGSLILGRCSRSRSRRSAAPGAWSARSRSCRWSRRRSSPASRLLFFTGLGISSR
jgi:spermidine/putrescine transport system permease protein